MQQRTCWQPSKMDCDNPNCVYDWKRSGRLGYVASLNRPGGNVTGVVLLTSNLGAKRIGLLRQLIPKVDAVGVLVNPTYPVSAAQLKEVQEAAANINVRLIVANASADRDFESAFALLVQQGAGALLVAADP